MNETKIITSEAQAIADALRACAIHAGIVHNYYKTGFIFPEKLTGSIAFDRVIATPDTLFYRVVGFRTNHRCYRIFLRPQGYLPMLDYDHDYRFDYGSIPSGIQVQDLYSDDLLRDMSFATNRHVAYESHLSDNDVQGVWYVVKNGKPYER